MIMETERLFLKSPEEVTAKACADYYKKNRAFLEAFEPAREDAFFTEKHHQALLEAQQQAWIEKRGFRFRIMEKSASDVVIGEIALSEIVMGAFCSCFLGYKLDEEHRNRGYMAEAVNRVVRFAFEETGLHRIEGNVMPRNGASIAVLEKCGFVREGVSQKYLRINGVWEDHVHYVIINEAME